MFYAKKEWIFVIIIKEKEKKMNSNKQYDDLYIIMIDIDQIFILHSQLVCFNRNKKLLRISCNSCRSFDVYCDDVKKSDISMLDEHRTKQKVVKWWIANYW